MRYVLRNRKDTKPESKLFTTFIRLQNIKLFITCLTDYHVNITIRGETIKYLPVAWTVAGKKGWGGQSGTKLAHEGSGEQVETISN